MQNSVWTKTKIVTQTWLPLIPFPKSDHFYNVFFIIFDWERGERNISFTCGSFLNKLNEYDEKQFEIGQG